MDDAAARDLVLALANRLADAADVLGVLAGRDHSRTVRLRELLLRNIAASVEELREMIKEVE